MDPLEQNELEHRMGLLGEDNNRNDLHTFYSCFLKAVNLMAAAKPSLLFSLETMALPPQFDCSPDLHHHIASIVSQQSQKSCPPQCIYLVTTAPKHFAHLQTQNQPIQHRHPPRKKPPPSQLYPTPHQHQYSDS